MTPEEAKRLLVPGTRVQYAPSIIPGRETSWFNGVVNSPPRRLGPQSEECWVVGLSQMEPAYDVATGRRGRTGVAAASVEHVRLAPAPKQHGPCAGEHTCAEYAELEKWRDEATAALVQIRNTADMIRRMTRDRYAIPEPPNYNQVGCGVPIGGLYDEENAEKARALANDILHQIAKVLP